MTSRRDTLKLLGTAAGAMLAPHVLAAQDAGPALKDLAKAKGMRFGNAMGMLEDQDTRKSFRDPAYRALMARECNLIVAENETKWQALQPKPGPYQWGPADEMFAWARKEGMAVRGHTLIWQDPKWLPAWVNALDLKSKPVGHAEAILREHIKTVCTHMGQDVISHDVVNEAVSPKDGSLIQNVFTRRMGAVEQIEFAFRQAHEHAPKAQLVYNDFMGPGLGDDARHRAGVLKLLAELKKRGAPIHALGLQSHISAGDMMSGPANAAVLREWRKFLDEVTGMGLDLLITEFDVNDKAFPADVAKRDAATAALARDYLDVTLSYPTCRDFLLWGMADHVNWLQVWADAKRPDGLAQRPTPYDSQLRAKPMREAIAASLRAMPMRKA
ncbi:endo-1,4-beta-xylanase [Massilia sp. UYP32]|uniref:endo-1,4-beta-xylanase n=1 Tax=Massilia sp. UYP32 TaxID=1756386 RepID=UPI003D1CBDBC